MKPNKLFFFIGLIAGLILPFVTIVILHAVRFDHYTFQEFIEKLLMLQIAGKFISIAAYPNLLLFFVFIWLNKLYGARGVITATFLITLLMLIIKIV